MLISRSVISRQSSADEEREQQRPDAVGFHSVHLPKVSAVFLDSGVRAYEPGTGASWAARTSPMIRPASNEKMATRTVTEMARKMRMIVSQQWFCRVAEFFDSDFGSALASNS